MAKKMMQIDVYDDGTVKVLDAKKTEEVGKPIEAEKGTWKTLHKYLKTKEEKEAVVEKQMMLVVTNPCAWFYINKQWHWICW
jgi:hypothetical protein